MTNKIIVLATLSLAFFGGCSSNEERRTEIKNDSANVGKNSPASSSAVIHESLPKVTRQQFDQIKLGMTKSEVEKILGTGKPGKNVADESVSGDTYRWSVGGFMLISITFQDDKVKGIAEKTN